MSEAERSVTKTRTTDETSVSVTISLDGSGETDLDTGVPIFDHFLAAFACHGRFDLSISVDGDTETGPHHTIEDVGIVLGRAVRDAVQSGDAIERFADCRVPMDEAVADIILDVSGRPHFEFSGRFSQSSLTEVPTDMFRHFLDSFTTNATVTLHASVRGQNAHHECEALFKGLGRTLDLATRETSEGTNSTKGTLFSE